MCHWPRPLLSKIFPSPAFCTLFTQSESDNCQRFWFLYTSVSCYRSDPCSSPYTLFCPNLIPTLSSRGCSIGFCVPENFQLPCFRSGEGLVRKQLGVFLAFKKKIFFQMFCILKALDICFALGFFLLTPHAFFYIFCIHYCIIVNHCKLIILKL